MADARKLAALDQQLWQRQRLKSKSEAQQQMVLAKRLVKQRDSGKRKFEDMSATEQQRLEDLETNKIQKRYEEASGKKLPYFRGKML